MERLKREFRIRRDLPQVRRISRNICIISMLKEVLTKQENSIKKSEGKRI